jgi:hypothetical protein
MNPRERTMAILTAALVVLAGGYYLWSSVEDSLQLRRNRLNAVMKQQRDQESLLKQASRASRDLAEIQKRALPGDRERARSLYEQWLLNLTEQCQFADPSIRPLDRRVKNASYEQHSFQLEGQATLPQVMEFLAKFYQVNDLHRINQLTLAPVKDSRMLDVVCWVDAVALPDVKRAAVGDQPSQKLPVEQIQAAQQAVVQRAMFFPPNNPPQLERIGKQQVVLGSSLSVTASVSDPDSWDELQFQLGAGAPEGAKLEPGDRGKARIRWEPKEKGTFVVPLEVRDTGYPPRTVQATIEVTVVDPPPPPPPAPPKEEDPFEFNLRHAFLVATTQGKDGRSEAWFEVRTTGDRPRVGEGQPLRIGKFRGTVTSVAPNHVDVLRERDQKTLRVRIGQHLEEALELEAPST